MCYICTLKKFSLCKSNYVCTYKKFLKPDRSSFCLLKKFRTFKSGFSCAFFFYLHSPCTLFGLTFSLQCYNLITVINFEDRNSHCMKTGYKTKQQDLVLSFLKSTNGAHFTVDEVRLHFLHQNCPLGVATIYRQLEKFVADGSVVKYFIDDKSAACFQYIGGECENGGAEKEHFHIKCEKCGKLIHLDCSELEHLQQHLQQQHGIALNPFRTVFYGTCAACQGEIDE